MEKLSSWIKAFRLRTLPLALSSIFTGSFLALEREIWDIDIFILASLTTLFLQILSNLANDYGDALSGADNDERIGPDRMMQSGAISMTQMRVAILIFILLSLASGIWLILLGTQGLKWGYGIFFFLLGVMAIGAAIKYTVGKNPYGYAGLGDLFVLIFFGWVGVIGSYYLHTHEFDMLLFLPATSIGAFSTAVLNLNNMRDREVDMKFGKQTLVVRMGQKASRNYHIVLLLLGMILLPVYSLIQGHEGWNWIYLSAFPLFLSNLVKVLRVRNPVDLDPELRKVALGTFLLSLAFGLGMIL